MPTQGDRLSFGRGIVGRIKVRKNGWTLRQRVRHRLVSSPRPSNFGDHHDLTNLVSTLGALSRSLRSGSSLRQAIAEAGSHQTSGVLHLLDQRLRSGLSLEEACGEFWSAPKSKRTFLRLRRIEADETALVIHVIELAHAMGGNEARLIDSLIHALIERQHIHSERQTQAATALSSMRMLTWLPIGCGLWIMTESPTSRSFIVHSTAGQICLVVGISLNFIGRHWAQRIVSPA